MRWTGGEVVVEALIQEGVPYVIGIPGHGNLALVDALFTRKERIRVLQVKQEMSAVHMADGYYRVTGNPLAVFTSIGPGAVNTAIGVATAYVDSTAVLVITGSTHTHMRGKGVLQEVERSHDANFPRMLEPVVKRYWRVDQVGQLPTIMQRAFNQMLTGRRGPVLIDLPMNVQADATDVELKDAIRREPQGRVLGDPDQIARAARLLVAARRPVILAGGGALTSGASEELTAIAEHLGAAMINSFQGKSVFPEDHPLYGWLAGSKGTTCGNRLTVGADVILAVGCRFADETTSSYKHGVSFAIPPTRLIHVDIDPTEIGKNYPVEVGIVGDAKAVASALLETLRDVIPKRDMLHSDYFAEIQQLKRTWLKHVEGLQHSDREPVTISRALKEIRDVLDRDAVVATSSGNVQAQLLQEFPFYVPRTNLTTGGFSTMGFALPAALGAQLALPDRAVVAIVGDGDFMMTMQELSTAVQLDLPVVTVIANNMAWMAIQDLQMGAFGEDRAFATEFLDRKGNVYSPDFKAIAEAFGCYAEKVSKPGEVGPALQRALRTGRPAVIEVLVNREYPYSGSPAMGWWDVPVPAYLKDKRAAYEREIAEERL